MRGYYVSATGLDIILHILSDVIFFCLLRGISFYILHTRKLKPREADLRVSRRREEGGEC